MILNHNLHLLILRKLCIEFTEHFLSIEAAGNKENEMGRFLRKITSEALLELSKSVGLDGNVTLKLVSYENNLLDVACQPLLLNFSPLFFLWIGTTLIEEHPTDAEHQKNVYPAEIEGDFYTTALAGSIIILLFCHICLS